MGQMIPLRGARLSVCHSGSAALQNPVSLPSTPARGGPGPAPSAFSRRSSVQQVKQGGPVLTLLKETFSIGPLEPLGSVLPCIPVKTTIKLGLLNVAITLLLFCLWKRVAPEPERERSRARASPRTIPTPSAHTNVSR